MNAQTRIVPPAIIDDDSAGFDITAFMVANGVLRIGRHDDNFNVYLTGDKFGGGKSFEEAFDNARGLA